MNSAELMHAKLRHVYWDTPAPRAVPATDRFRDELNEFLQDGMLAHERRVTIQMEAMLGHSLPRPIDHESLSVYRDLTPSRRYEILNLLHANRDAKASTSKAMGQFLAEQGRWRDRQLQRACNVLAKFDRQLQAFSPIDLSRIEGRYMVGRLPLFPNMPNVQSRTTKIVIAMVASSAAHTTSRNLHLDRRLAVLVAAKFDDFLSAQQGKIRQSIKATPVKKLK